MWEYIINNVGVFIKKTSEIPSLRAARGMYQLEGLSKALRMVGKRRFRHSYQIL